MPKETLNNKRIAKNTLFLYFRTLLILVVSIFPSRVLLNVLGVEDYGTYNVVGGVVAMFSAISGALSAAISRFITFELGKEDEKRLGVVFSTSVNIQIGLSLIVILIGEIVGIWFLNNQMNIPSERLYAANWVLQCSLITFCVNLISIPYNACIIAHEKMDAFAYISIFEVLLKLGICYLIMISPWDKLISYAVLLVYVSLIIRFTYGFYCHRHFAESHYRLVYERGLLKEMSGFAGWNFFTNGAYIFNTQGINILVNIFFGVTVNAARGIASQVDHAIMHLVNSFTTALNPQITKNYAAGNRDAMLLLVCQGAKFSYMLLFLMSLPIMMETEYILKIWLKIVPEHAATFVRLAIMASLVNIIGKTGYTAAMATGTIRRYVIWITSVGCLVFPISWIAFFLGAPSEAPYIVFIVVYIAVECVRLWILKGLLDFPISRFVREVVIKIILVTIASIPLPLFLVSQFPASLYRMIMTVLTSVLSTVLCVYWLGLNLGERNALTGYIKRKIRR